jgi:penicillin-binding protein 1A
MRLEARPLCCACRAAVTVRVRAVRACAEALGLPIAAAPTLSMALGSGCATPLQMAGAYATLAARGLAAEPHLIRLVKDARGATLFRHRPAVRRAARRCASPPLARMHAVLAMCGRSRDAAVRAGTLATR